MAKDSPRKPREDVFVLTLPLRVNQKEERELGINLEAIRQIYNACIGEALKRLRKLRDSAEWQAARELPKLVKSVNDKQVFNPARAEAFQAANVQYEFTQASLESFATKCKNDSGLVYRLGAPETQRMAQRAFQAVQQYCFGVRGRPRFKGFRGVRSLEGKSDAAALRWRDGHLCYGGMKLKALLNPKDACEVEALGRKVRYSRLVRKTIKGRIRYYVQLMLTGKSPTRKATEPGIGVVGMDQGPTVLAVVAQATPETAAEAYLVKFCATVEPSWKEQRRAQRAMDRSRRANNPKNYDAKGRIVRGRKKWTQSTRGKRLRAKFRRKARRVVAERERAHGHLGNDILRKGNQFNWEKVSYLSFQKNYGRSVQVRAPGEFFRRFERKAASAGARTNEFSTCTTKLSQFCHIGRTYVKKPLSQRLHVFPDGSWVDRDLYSAWLGCSIHEATLDADRASQAWSAAQLPLRTASRTGLQSASGRGLPRPTVSGPSERIVRNRDMHQRYYGAGGTNRGATRGAEVLEQCYAPGRGSSTPTRNPVGLRTAGETRPFRAG